MQDELDDVEARMSVRNFGKAMLVAFIVGCAIGGFVGYAVGQHVRIADATMRGVNAERDAILLALTQDQPCVNALHICYTEIQQGTINAANAAMVQPR